MKALILLGAALAYSAIASARVMRPRGTNPFEGRQQLQNPKYADRAGIAAQFFASRGDGDLADKAIQIQRHNPTWTWIDHSLKVPQIEQNMRMVRGQSNAIATFVIYNLPDRECGSTKPPGEFSISADGIIKYMKFIESIKATLTRVADAQAAFIIEPRAISNLVAYKDNPKCQDVNAVYQTLIAYALTSLNFPNVAVYLDGGDSVTLGPDDRIRAAAKLFSDVYELARSPENVRGLSVNVGGYNLWSSASCGNGTDPNSANGNGTASTCDEQRYVNALSPLLSSMKWPNAHFIVDRSRDGVQDSLAVNSGHTCNLIAAGLGDFAGAGTGNPLVDSFIWAKPPGESDGTALQSSPLYNPDCDKDGSLPASDKEPNNPGDWSISYFRQLIINANPAIVPTWKNTP